MYVPDNRIYHARLTDHTPVGDHIGSLILRIILSHIFTYAQAFRLSVRPGTSSVDGRSRPGQNHVRSLDIDAVQRLDSTQFIRRALRRTRILRDGDARINQVDHRITSSRSVRSSKQDATCTGEYSIPGKRGVARATVGTHSESLQSIFSPLSRMRRVRQIPVSVR